MTEKNRRHEGISSPTIEIPVAEVERYLQDFQQLRAANLSGYGVMVESAFKERVGGQIGSPEDYLNHHIQHGATRIGLFDSNYPTLSLEEADKLEIAEKLAKYAEQTSKYTEILSDPANLARTLVVPYVGESTGLSVLVKLNLHELRHLDYLRAAFAKEGIPFTKPMEYMGV